jgi:molybdopterin synthase sulfur carrier subunit
MTTVLIPTPLRRLTANQSRVEVSGDTVAEVLAALDVSYPGVGERLLDQQGEIKRFINVFVNDDEIRTLQGASTPVAANDRITIVPAMAGGALAPVTHLAIAELPVYRSPIAGY